MDLGDEKRVVPGQIVNAGAGRDDGGDEDRKVEKGATPRKGRFDGHQEKSKNRGDHLGYGFMFPYFFGSQDDSLLSCDEPDSCDQKLPGDHKGDEPDGKKACAKKTDEGDGDQKLVREGVEEAAKVRLDFPFSGEMTVQPVREGGGDKEGQSEPSGPQGHGWMGTGLKKDQQNKGGDDAADRKPIGKGHAMEFRLK